jgi:hypothetical protein
MEIGNLDRLLWIINFINEDIVKLKKANFIKLLIEMREYVPGLPIRLQLHQKVPDEIAFTYYFIEDTPRMRDVILGIQKQIKNVFDELFKRKNKFIEKTTMEFEDIFNWTSEISLAVGQGNIWLMHEMDKFLEYEIAKLIVNCSPYSSIYDKVETVDLPEDSIIRSLKNLKKCGAPGCEKYFWQAFKKEKNFCSNKCAWRAYSKEKRSKEKKANAPKGGTLKKRKGN